MELFEDKGMGKPDPWFLRTGLLCSRESPWLGIDRAGVLGESDYRNHNRQSLLDPDTGLSASPGGHTPRYGVFPA